MRINHHTISACFSRTFRGLAVILLLIGGNSSRILAQSSVEKSETTQQAKQPEDELARARAAVAKPGEKQTPPETGRIWGNYSVTSTLELGYRFLDTDGNRNRFYSDVNVRSGFRVLDYSMDARSILSTGALFDFLHTDVQNAGGDQGQYFSIRADKTRIYKFDGTVRRFNYFRQFLPTLSYNASTFAGNEHTFDLRQQVSDFNLKLFPQRAVRINLAYGRSMAKGPFTRTYDYERDEFLISGNTRWEANDYRLGTDITFHHWNIFAEQMYRNFRNDTEYFNPSSATNPGNNVTNSSVLTFFDRDSPTRSRALVTRGSVQGNLTSRAHLVIRALHGDERLEMPLSESTLGTDGSNRKILSRSDVATALAKRPSTTVDALFTYDVAERVSISNSFRYTSYRILGDFTELDQSQRQPVTGGPVTVNTSLVDNRFTDLTSYWNTLEVRFALGTKFSANLGWRISHRDVTLRTPILVSGAPSFINGQPQFTQDDESENTNAFIGGVRYRPTKRASLFFDVEKGTSDNAFVRVNPLDYTRFRLRTSFQATDKLSFNSTLTTADSTNPTRFVQNDSNARAVSVDTFWQPNARVWVTGGYDYNHLASTAEIAFFLSSVLNTGHSRYYARENFLFLDSRLALTTRLDLLLAYRYLQDRGAPTNIGPLGPNDFVTALPLRRHNPEARIAYRFSNHVTGNIAYRRYDYGERLSLVQNYRANILTTSMRFTF